MTNNNAIRDKVVVVTGGARGIGFATATALHHLGAKVAIGDVDEAKLKESATALGVDVYGELDVTDPYSFSTFLDDVERQLGPLDVLINNAGIMPAGSIIEEPNAVTRRILDINTYGVILGSKLAAQRMIPRRRGHIINIASLAGESPTPGLATYCASKYAVSGSPSRRASSAATPASTSRRYYPRSRTPNSSPAPPERSSSRTPSRKISPTRSSD